MAKIRMKKKRYKRAKLIFGLLNLKPIIFCRSRFRRCRHPTARPHLLLKSPRVPTPTPWLYSTEVVYKSITFSLWIIKSQ